MLQNQHLVVSSLRKNSLNLSLSFCFPQVFGSVLPESPQHVGCIDPSICPFFDLRSVLSPSVCAMSLPLFAMPSKMPGSSAIVTIWLRLLSFWNVIILSIPTQKYPSSRSHPISITSCSNSWDPQSLFEKFLSISVQKFDASDGGTHWDGRRPSPFAGQTGQRERRSFYQGSEIFSKIIPQLVDFFIIFCEMFLGKINHKIAIKYV